MSEGTKFRPIGIVGENSSPTEVDIKALTPVPTGTYIYIRFRVKDPIKEEEQFREVIGIIGSSTYRSVVPIVTTPNLGMYEVPTATDYKKESFMKALLIADITNGYAEVPRHPPPPESPVYPASPNHLRIVYSYDVNSSVRVGTLAGFEDIEVRVNINALAKHLLITGATGSGKSNLVSIIADRVAQVGGSVVIFDVHGEYVGLESEDPAKVTVVNYDASINLIKSPISLLVNFIIPERQATKQRRILRNAIRRLNNDIVDYSLKYRISYSEAVKRLYNEKLSKGKKDLLSDSGADSELNPLEAYRELLKYNVIGLSDSKLKGGLNKAVEDVIDKIDDFFEWHKVSLDSPEVSEVLGSSKIVVVDVSPLTDEEKDWMLKVIAENILWSLKERKVIPTLLVVEEAHIFLSKDTTTISKQALQRFIREGRKFGAMLAVVSQRPRALDTNVVSQVQNYAFLKLIQRSDRSTVMDISDILSDEYANILPTLPPGYGILLGEWIGRYPVYTKIDYHAGKRVGATPNIMDIWVRNRELISKRREKALELSSLSNEWEVK